MQRISVTEVVKCAGDEVISPEAVGLFTLAAVNVEYEQTILVNGFHNRFAQRPRLHDPNSLAVKACVHVRYGFSDVM